VRARRDSRLLATFDHEINLLQDFTDRLDLLEKAVVAPRNWENRRLLTTLSGSSVMKKCDLFPAARAVVITDGEDTTVAPTCVTQSISRSEPRRKFLRSRQERFFQRVPGVEMGEVKTRMIATWSSWLKKTGGGQHFLAENDVDPRALIHKDRQELRSQYLNTYRPTNDRYDGSYRRIDVKLTSGQGDSKGKTKKGIQRLRMPVSPDSASNYFARDYDFSSRCF